MASLATLPDLSTLDAEALKMLVLAQHNELLSHKNEIEHLRLLIAKLRRMMFGRSSEKIRQQVEQLELKLEELEAVRAEHTVSPSASPAVGPERKPSRCSLPEHLPRRLPLLNTQMTGRA